MFLRKLIIAAALVLPFTGCQKQPDQPAGVAPSSLRDVPALRLNFRYEADVPAPEQAAPAPAVEERNALVQADFDQNRPQEMLDMTVTSPDKQRVLAVFHNVMDVPNEYRLEMYAADGKSLKLLTHEGMAVHFPETIRWAPDSSAVAFAAMARLAKTGGLVNEDGESANGATPVPTVETTPDGENANINAAPAAPAESPQSAQTAPPVLTFRTEQIYLADANGNDVKPVTQNEGLIYFYYVWSPDSSALAALAAKATEWKIFQFQADQRGEVFRPAGRPRIIEKTGRQRLLDDYPTQVHPVWSPDSAKVAAAFDKQIRIYDAIGNAPTQAAILLRNQLLLSSKTYDEVNKPEAPQPANTNTNSTPNKNINANVPAELPEGVLPDENSLVSFNPIVTLRWTEDPLLYFETAYVKEYKESVNNVRSFSRWHRLVLSPQAVALTNQ